MKHITDDEYELLLSMDNAEEDGDDPYYRLGGVIVAPDTDRYTTPGGDGPAP